MIDAASGLMPASLRASMMAKGVCSEFSASIASYMPVSVVATDELGAARAHCKICLKKPWRAKSCTGRSSA